MQQVKVLFFFPNSFWVPTVTVYTQVMRHLDRTRVLPYLAISSDAEDDLRSIGANGIPVYRGNFGRTLKRAPLAALRSWVPLPGSMISLARYARREGIHIVQCDPARRTAVLGLLLARLAGCRLLLHYHGVPEPDSIEERLLRHVVRRRADHTVTVSKFVAAHVRQMGIPVDKVDAVLNGVDLTRFHPGIDGSAIRHEYGIHPNAPLVLQLARIHQRKRQEDMVRAFAIARRTVPSLRCLLVGWEGPGYHGPFPSYKAELEDICAREKLGDSLIIAPARPDAPQLMAAADIVTLPSLDDPCPLVVIETMASGKPVIGADSGGIPELIADGVSGFLVPPRSPEALAEKMVLLATDPTLRAHMGKAARHWAETYFDEKRLAAELAPIYEALASDRSVGHLSKLAVR